MNRKRTLGIVSILGLVLMPTIVGIGYWNDMNQADCGVCHNAAARFFYNPNLGITLDGQRTEAAWNYRRGTRIIMPVAFENGTNHRFVEMAFVRDTEYIYISAKWQDLEEDQQDSIYFCWNVSMANFTAAFYAGMNTSAPGEWVDSWKIYKGTNVNGSERPAEDDAFTNTGWDNTGDAKDVRCAMIHYEGIYQVEIQRKITTVDGNRDVQFDRDNYYAFNIGISDLLAHQYHLVSQTYLVKFETTPVAEDLTSGTPDQWNIFHEQLAQPSGPTNTGDEPGMDPWMVVSIIMIAAFAVVVPVLFIKLKGKRD